MEKFGIRTQGEKGITYVVVTFRSKETCSRMGKLLSTLPTIGILGFPETAENDDCCLMLKVQKDLYDDQVEETITRILELALKNEDALLYRDDVLAELKDFPESNDAFEKGLTLLELGDCRTGLDQLRLSVELLAKVKAGNDKSLENQTEKLKELLGRNGFTGPLISAVVATLNAFTRFENDYVKHDSGKRIMANDVITYKHPTVFLLSCLLRIKNN